MILFIQNYFYYNKKRQNKINQIKPIPNHDLYYEKHDSRSYLDNCCFVQISNKQYFIKKSGQQRQMY